MKSLYKHLFFLSLLLYAWGVKAQMDEPINFELPAAPLSQPVVGAEYFWDTDPGLGTGTPIALTQGADVEIPNFQVGIGNLSAGVHYLYLRAKNASGIWGMSQMHSFYVMPASGLIPAQKAKVDIKAAEYFIDADPGLGAGTSIAIPAGDSVTVQNLAIDISGLSKGVHYLHFRVQNNAGVWSQTNRAVLYKLQQQAVIPAQATLTDIVQGEYFVDTDPGLGAAISIPFTAGSDINAAQVVVDISGLSAGVHYVYTRFKNAAGQWSLNGVSAFFITALNYAIPPHPAVGKMTAIEYFFDVDPGFGNGTLLSIAPTDDLVDYQFSVDLTGLKMDSVHTLYVRALDGWSMTTAASLELGHAVPVTWISFTGKREAGGAVLLEWKTALEQQVASYVVEKSTDGVHFTAIHSMAPTATVDANGHHLYSYRDLQATEQQVTYRIKQVDKDGKSSYSSLITVHNVKGDGAGFYVINNPVQQSLKVYLDASRQQGTLQVFDMNGRQLMQQAVRKQTVQQLDVSMLSAGTYIIRYVSGSQQESRKFIKR